MSGVEPEQQPPQGDGAGGAARVLLILAMSAAGAWALAHLAPGWFR